MPRLLPDSSCPRCLYYLGYKLGLLDAPPRPRTTTSGDDEGVDSASTKRRKEAKEQRQRDLGASYVEHTLGIEQLAEVHADSHIEVDDPANSSGLSSLESRERLIDGGRNVLAPPKSISNWQLFSNQYFYKFWLLLLGAALLSLITYFIRQAQGGPANAASRLNLACAVILFGVVVVMSALSGWQERRSIDILSRLQLVLPHNCYAIRDGHEIRVASEELVVGDLVSICCGQRIYADLRIIAASGLKIEASAITGDSTPIDYNAEAVAAYISVFDAHNTAFKGSYCTEGGGIGVVIRTGQYTMLGNFAEIEAESRRISRSGLLHKELSKFVNRICVLAIAMALLFFVVGCLLGGYEKNVLDCFITGFLIVIVANVPQGLPATLMAQLAIIARRMGKKNVVIKKLDVIDELGAVTVIAADKAGTLTKDHLVLTDLWYDRDHHSALEELKRAKAHHTPQQTHFLHPISNSSRSTTTTNFAPRRVELNSSFTELLAIAAVCNRAHNEPASKRSKVALATELVLGSALRKQTLTKSQSAHILSQLASSPSSGRGVGKRVAMKKFVVINEDSGDRSLYEVEHAEYHDPPKPGSILEALKHHLVQNNTLSIALARRAYSEYCEAEKNNGPNDDDDGDGKMGGRKKSALSLGSPLDTALLHYVNSIASVEGIRSRFRTRLEIPFNSVRCWQLVVAECLFVPKSPDAVEVVAQMNSRVEAVHVVMVKGAPEVVLAMCNQALMDDEVVETDGIFKEECRKAWEYYGSKGSRVIGFALRHFNARRDINFASTPESFPTDSLVFVGMVALLDPPRAESKKAIQQCKEAGVKVYMITGDHPTTAYAVATKIGLIDNLEGEGDSQTTSTNGASSAVIERDSESGRSTVQSTKSRRRANWSLVVGESLHSMSKKEWDSLLSHPYIVFARTTLEQKLRIVEECQRRGEIVAVTGGGVNDAPALARANVGIAMGASGSDVARRAANIILADDNFSSIIGGIEEGRLLFDNLRLSIAYTLAHLWPEVFPIVLYFALGMPLGLNPLQILCIDLACELPPAVSLAYERPERDIMSVPPRSRNAPLVSRQLLAYSYIFSGVAITAGCFGAYISVYWAHDISFTDLLFISDRYFNPLTELNYTTPSSGIMYSPNKQMEIRGQAAAAWQITLVICQVFHVFMCTTRRQSCFRHGVHNFALVIAIMIEVLLLSLFVFTPSMQHFMRINTPPVHVWLFAPVVGIYLLVFNEARKWIIRRRANSTLARCLKW